MDAQIKVKAAKQFLTDEEMGYTPEELGIDPCRADGRQPIVYTTPGFAPPPLTPSTHAPAASVEQ